MNLFFTPHRGAGTLADKSSTPETLAVETKYHEVGKKYICWDVAACCTQPSWHTLHSVHQLAGDQHLSQKHLRCLLSFWHREWGLLSLACSMGSLCSFSPFPQRETSTWQNCGCSSTQRKYWHRVQELKGISNYCTATSSSTPFSVHSARFPDTQQPTCHAACPVTPSPRAPGPGPVSHSRASIPAPLTEWGTSLCLLRAFPRTSGYFYGPVLEDME